MTMYELCAECRNWFLRGVVRGTFTVSGGNLGEITGAQTGQYIRIVGSVYNDGVHKYPVVGLADETFTGAVWLLGIPQDFEALLKDINAWEAANSEAIAKATAEVLSAGPYTSESFAGYTYTKKTGIGDVATTWRDPRLGFAKRLNAWRKANHEYTV